jgi:hypothetical protein
MKTFSKKRIFTIGIIVLVVIAFAQIRCTNQPAAPAAMTQEQLVERGKYLVNSIACNDCHSPKIFTEMGPVPDSTRLLSGHPANSPAIALDSAFLHPGYGYFMSADLTEFVGPWGISFAANLTPDSATGIGAWTEEQFANTIRSGKHLGLPGGRDILPPMPWNWIAHLTDEDLNAIYSFLRSLPAISNKVPAPVAPPDVIALVKMMRKK